MMKRALKQVLGQSLFAAQLDALLLKGCAVVVAFHRVKETDGRDGLTVDTATFAKYCRFFKRHFHVVSLSALVDRLESGARLDRELAITFDDGYRDNFDNAAPVLEELSLPATFFVVSQWVGTEIVPWWDRDRGCRHPWMTWDQVRSLHGRGFQICAHTRTHPDLGTIAEDDARDEIFGARSELEQRLGTPVDLFAYPYGQPDNLSEANRALVKAAGFRCCCSCVGGVITTGSDPFRLARVPVTPGSASPQQFGFEVALGMSVLSA